MHIHVQFVAVLGIEEKDGDQAQTEILQAKWRPAIAITSTKARGDRDNENLQR